MPRAGWGHDKGVQIASRKGPKWSLLGVKKGSLESARNDRFLGTFWPKKVTPRGSKSGPHPWRGCLDNFSTKIRRSGRILTLGGQIDVDLHFSRRNFTFFDGISLFFRQLSLFVDRTWSFPGAYSTRR